MQYAFRSFNEVVNGAWQAIAPAVPVILDSPDDNTPLPNECLRIFWQDYGLPTAREGEYIATIDIAVRVPPINMLTNHALAIKRWAAIAAALGYDDPNMTCGKGGAGYGSCARWNWTPVPKVYLSEMRILPEGSLMPIPTGSPGLLHLAKTMHLLYTTSLSLPFA